MSPQHVIPQREAHLYVDKKKKLGWYAQTPQPFVTENREYLVQPEREMSKKTS